MAPSLLASCCGALLLLLVQSGPASAAIVAFTGGDFAGWQTWDWGAMTHLGFWSDPSDEIKATARRAGVRLFIDSHLPSHDDWTDKSKRAAFAAAKAAKVKEHGLDGVFFDYEGNDLDAAHKQAYVQLAKDTSAALAPLNATIFICVGGRPTYEWRDYPYADLAANSEFLFIMGYDMHFWDDYTCVLKGTCSAAEAALPDLQDGVKAYAAAVDPQKLVLGLPWYGQRYTDVVLPFNRGQIDYKTVLQAFDQKGLVTKKELDKKAMSWKITCKGSCDVESGKGGNVVYYDDAQTLAPKYALARDHGLLGVGMWKADNLPLPDDKGQDPHKAERQAMWSAIASWKNKTKTERESEILTETLAETFAETAAAVEVEIVQTSEKSGRLSPQPGAAFSPTKSSKATQTIRLSSSAGDRDVGATIKGFGGAFTDSVAEVFSQLNSTLQETVLEALWGETGNRYSLARLTIGSTDFSTTVYNYNMNPDDSTPDYDQEKFSIKHDEDKIIPLIHRAQKKAQDGRSDGEGIRFLSSSWSPPAWMKRPYLALKGHMRNSAKPGMKDDPKIFESYALYLSKYVSAYKAAGVDVEMMTIQNEPDSADHMFPVAYPACNFNGTGEGSFLRDHLGPRMHKDHPDMKIYVHDGQKFHDVPILDRVKAIVAAAGGDTYIHGVAFHWYGNNLKNYQFLEELHETFPQFDLLATEATLEAPSRQTLGTSPWKEAQKYAVDIIGDLNAGASGWIEWNVLLDSSGGPTCIGTTGGTDCIPLIGHCDAPILADTKKQTLEIRDTYYFMGHFSRFIPPGSTHVAFAEGSDGTDTNTSFMATAARTPAGDTVVVVLNTDEKNSVHYQLELDGQFAALKIPPHGIQTLTIPKGKTRSAPTEPAVQSLLPLGGSGDKCETCEKVAHLISEVVKFGNVTSQECIEIGDKMCSAVAPGDVEKKACDAIVSAVAAMKDEIIKGLMPPKKICQYLKFCGTRDVRSFPLRL